MMAMTRAAPSTSSRSRQAPREPPGREAGRNARMRLLEAAGQVFAEKGFANATGTEICRRAGVNTAAVNYYFGGMESLHSATVREAHHRLISLEALAQAVAGRRSAKAKLEAAVNLITRALHGAAPTWEMPVLAREIVSPSKALEELREREILPKATILKAIVGELLGLPAEHPTVARGCLNVIAPFLMLAIVDRATVRAVFPGLNLGEGNPHALAQSMLRYALTGLKALARDARKDRAEPGAGPLPPAAGARRRGGSKRSGGSSASRPGAIAGAIGVRQWDATSPAPARTRGAGH
jgi:TetR/AcrR family transcriptional regulator, regulator of cefoperazone and chloramphenicol sensitivity